MVRVRETCIVVVIAGQEAVPVTTNDSFEIASVHIEHQPYVIVSPCRNCLQTFIPSMLLRSCRRQDSPESTPSRRGRYISVN